MKERMTRLMNIKLLKETKMSSRGLRNHAKNVNSILGYVSAHDKETQPNIVVKVGVVEVVVEVRGLWVRYHTYAFWQMYDFYPTCLEKNKHVSIITPKSLFPHMFGFWHICTGKRTNVWKKPHHYLYANFEHFPHMCGKGQWHAHFPPELSLKGQADSRE